MDVHELIEQARQGRYRPVYVLTGAERFLVERAVRHLRAACLGDGPSGFNDDLFHGSSLSAGTVTSAAKTLPMMAAARFVLVRNAHLAPQSELDLLVPYLEDPCPSTCLVIVADKLDGTRRFTKAAKKQKVLVDAQALKGGAVRAFAVAEARARGHHLGGRAADALAEATGDDLASIDDALERLSLYVGEGAAIEVDAIDACVSRVPTDTIWALVDAVAVRDTRAALAASSSLVAAREAPLRILAMVARQLRMVARMRQALAAGLRGKDATKEAGAPPFKARQLTQAARRFTAPQLGAAFHILSEADRAMKGSKVPAEVVLQDAVLSLCRSDRAVPRRVDRRPRVSG